MTAALIPLKGRKSRESQSAMIRGLAIFSLRSGTVSNLLQFSFSEKSSRFDEKYYDQDDEGIGILVFA